MWVSDPGTGPIGFVSKFRAVWWYLCVRNTDLEPDRAKVDFGTPLPKKNSKVCPNSALIFPKRLAKEPTQNSFAIQMQCRSSARINTSE